MRLLLLTFLLLLPVRGEDFKFMGDQAWSDGFYGQAWTYYSKALSRAPEAERPLLLQVLSSAASKAGKVKESLEELNIFLEGPIARKLDITAQSRLYYSRAVLETELQRWNEAVESSGRVLDNIKKISPELLQKTLDTAVYALINAGKLEEASGLLEKHQKSFADSTAAELQNARLKILLGQYVNAIAILDKYSEAVEARPHFLAMWAYQKSGNTARALEIYQKKLSDNTVKDEPLFADVLIKLAEESWAVRKETAVKIFNKAYSLTSDTGKKGHIILKKAELYVLDSDKTNAVSELQGYLKEYPDSEKTPVVNFQLALLFSGSESSEEELLKAETYVTSAVDKAESKLQYKSLVLRGGIRGRMKQMDAAAADLQSAASLVKDLNLDKNKAAGALFSAAVIRYRQALDEEQNEQYLKAAEIFAKIPALKSEYTEKAMLMQAQSFRRAGEYGKAVEVLKKAVEKYPQNADAAYLYGTALVENGNYDSGIKELNRFTSVFAEDVRSARAYTEALNAAVTGLNGAGSETAALKIISQFGGAFAKNKDSVHFVQADPVMLHLQAVLHWKQNRFHKAAHLWEQFLEEYPDHYMSVNVRLWTALHLERRKDPDLEAAARQYEIILSAEESQLLQPFTMLQSARNSYRRKRFAAALEILAESEEKYRGQIEAGAADTEELTPVLFFSGEVHTRLGQFEKALEYFQEALKHSRTQNVQEALKGRIADCLFSLAGHIKGIEEKLPEFLEKLNKAAQYYEDIYRSGTASKSFKEQALYKLAKCEEERGLTGENEQTNVNLDNARNHLFKLFFNYQDDVKKGVNRDPYYFCRAGYDLARLQLSFNDPNIRSALSTYRILAESGLPGTVEAKFMADELEKVLKEVSP